MEQAHHLQPVLVLLVVGILAIGVMRPLRMSPIVGYLIAGMLIGSHGLGWIEESDTTHLLAELGVVFLLFDIGLHFSLGNIWDARRDILGLGPIQITLCTAAFTLMALLMGLNIDYAIVIGATLALSSTAVAVQVLADNQQNRCPVAVSAAATAQSGLSMTLGAFLAGMIISETPYRHAIQSEVKPFRGFCWASSSSRSAWRWIPALFCMSGG
jgi:CPA2 family monovalent cation:H+ antiporter-2